MSSIVHASLPTVGRNSCQDVREDCEHVRQVHNQLLTLIKVVSVVLTLWGSGGLHAPVIYRTLGNATILLVHISSRRWGHLSKGTPKGSGGTGQGTTFPALSSKSHEAVSHIFCYSLNLSQPRRSCIPLLPTHTSLEALEPRSFSEKQHWLLYQHRLPVPVMLYQFPVAAARWQKFRAVLET